LVLAVSLSAAGAYAAKLKTYYSGSGMASDGSSRVITLQFSTDGTGSFQQHSGQGDINKQIHWFRDGDKLTVELEPGPGQTPPQMVFEMKRNSLVPSGTFPTGLGVLGFPTLHPFGPADVGKSSGMTTCVTGSPGPCAMRETWNSNKSGP
jgi:hypothetical protein